MTAAAAAACEVSFFLIYNLYSYKMVASAPPRPLLAVCELLLL